MYNLTSERMKSVCISSGFAQKRKAFFRVVGDGVLQVVKQKYERVFRSDLIYIGLFSMYDQLLPQWFTATGCIPSYSVVNCVYLNNMPLISVPTVSVQIDMLQNKIIPWLDSVDTQKRLITAISKLDPRWNDSLKIGPYLACGELNHAKKVIREILAQHDFARSCRMEMLDYPSEKLSLRQTQEDNNLFALLKMINRADLTEIDTYLKANYARNMEYAKFCEK